jgi:hypothetical protein
VVVATMRTMVEIELWANCNNSCSFCWQQYKQQNMWDTTKRIEILDKCLNLINSQDFEKGSDVSLMGGELFIDDLFNNHKIVKFLIEKLQANDINNLYIYSNFFEIEKLEFFIEKYYFENIVNKLFIVTSFDIEGRFHTEQQKDKFLSNLFRIRSKYPKLSITVNMILTNKFCDAIVTKTFDIKKFENKYKTKFDFLPYLVLDESLRPTRDQVFRCFLTLEEMFPQKNYLKYVLDNFDYTYSKPKHFKFINNEFKHVEICNSKCGHHKNLVTIFNDGNCFACELQKLYYSFF